MIIKLQDQITPKLAALRKLGGDTTPVMRAMGTTFKSITEGTFNSAGASFRPSPWANKQGGTPSNLQKSTTMSKSFHLEVSPTMAAVYNPMPYAAIHQYGGNVKKRGPKGGEFLMPARPFFPVTPDGQLTPAAETLIVKAGERAAAKAIGN